MLSCTVIVFVYVYIEASRLAAATRTSLRTTPPPTSAGSKPVSDAVQQQRATYDEVELFQLKRLLGISQYSPQGHVRGHGFDLTCAEWAKHTHRLADPLLQMAPSALV